MAVQGGHEADAGAAEAEETESRPDVIGAGPVVFCGQACFNCPPAIVDPEYNSPGLSEAAVVRFFMTNGGVTPLVLV